MVGSSDVSFQPKFYDFEILTESDKKTEKAIQKLVDIYAQKNGGPNKPTETDPLQPIYYDFPNYYNFSQNIPATPSYKPIVDVR